MSFRDLILNNFWYKVFSLVLAWLIWVVIDANFTAGNNLAVPLNPLRPGVTRDFRRPVILMTPASNRRLFRIEPAEVSVTVRGDAVDIQKLSPDALKIYVDLVNVAEPQGSFILQWNVPADIVVQQVWPAHVQVQPLTNQNQHASESSGGRNSNTP